MAPELLAVQRSGGGVPVVKATLSDRLAGLPRLRWQRLYTGLEDDFHHASVSSGDGTLLRMRMDSGGLGYLQIITLPAVGSPFGAWVPLGALSAVSGVALATAGSSVLLFVVVADQRTILAVESTDNGHSFGAGVVVVTAPAAVTHLAAGINASGVVQLFYNVGATVYGVARTAGVWGAAGAWTNSVAAVSGLACTYHLDWDLAATGSTSAGTNHLWSCIFGDGFAQSAGTWSALSSIAAADTGSDVSYQSPYLDWFDTARLWFVEKFTGAGGYSRLYHSAVLPGASFADGLWLEPAPFDATSAYGGSLSHDGTAAWLSTPFGVWRAERTAPVVDVSADVTGLELHSQPFSGSAELTLNNTGGAYHPAAAGGQLALGAELEVRLGYQTPAGDRTVARQVFWVQQVRHMSCPGEASAGAVCLDGWGLLQQWRARHQFTWAKNTRSLFQLVAFVLARASLSLGILSSSTRFLSMMPAFTIQPGENGLNAVRRLLAMSGDALLLDGDFGFVVNPAASDLPVYSYGPGDHPLFRGTYVTAPATAARVQVYGAAAYGEQFDWAAVDTWPNTVRQVIDANIPSATDAAARATAELRLGLVQGDAGVIEAAVNCGQQLYDVVEVTDPAAGLQQARRRVNRLRVRYRRTGTPLYDIRLNLGGV